MCHAYRGLPTPASNYKVRRVQLTNLSLQCCCERWVQNAKMILSFSIIYIWRFHCLHIIRDIAMADRGLKKRYRKYNNLEIWMICSVTHISYCLCKMCISYKYVNRKERLKVNTGFRKLSAMNESRSHIVRLNNLFSDQSYYYYHWEILYCWIFCEIFMLIDFEFYNRIKQLAKS